MPWTTNMCYSLGRITWWRHIREPKFLKLECATTHSDNLVTVGSRRAEIWYSFLDCNTHVHSGEVEGWCLTLVQGVKCCYSVGRGARAHFYQHFLLTRCYLRRCTEPGTFLRSFNTTLTLVMKLMTFCRYGIFLHFLTFGASQRDTFNPGFFGLVLTRSSLGEWIDLGR